MRKSKTAGFEYHPSEETIKDYGAKPIELRLKWLYMGNLFRMGYPEKTKRLHDRFRSGKRKSIIIPKARLP